MPCLIQEAPRPFALILCLTLVNRSESADVELVALEVEAVKSGAGRPSVIQLPNLPALENCIASDNDFRKWSSLKDL